MITATHRTPPGEHSFLQGTINGWGDYVRLFDVFVGMAVVGVLVVLAVIRWREARRSSTLAYAMGICWGLSAVITEGRVIGTVITSRLWLNTAGIVLGVVMAVMVPREVARGLWTVDRERVETHERLHPGHTEPGQGGRTAE